jgi:acetyl esterase/lipase
MRYLCHAFLAALALAATAAAQPATVTVHRDLEYARPEGLPQRLDLYVPEGAGPWPLLVWVHGGGWSGGDKALNQAGVQVRQASRGYVVASVNYRLSGVATHPAQIHDVKAAIRWLRGHAAAYGIDPSRVGIWGSSAGGHLAALVGTSGGVGALEGPDNPGFSSTVSAVVDWYGPSDLPNMQAQGLPCSGDHSSASSPEGRMLGCAVPACPETAREASPITWVSSEDPPFLLVHGTADCTVPPLQSLTLHDALLAAGVDSTLTMIEGGGHGGPQWTDATRLPALEAFLDGRVRDAGPGSRWIVPAAARAPGAGGAFWTTSLTLANTGSVDASLSLRFLGHDVDGSAGPLVFVAVAAGQSITYADVLSGVFGLGEGWGAILVASSSASLAVVAQTSTSGGGGTFGQAVPAFSEGDLVRAEAVRSIPAVRQDGEFRTNLVLVNATDAPLEVDVALLDSAGAILASGSVPLPPLGMTQRTRVVRELGVESDLSEGRLVLGTRTTGGAFAAYASLIDAVTGDPRTLLPR